MLNTTAALGARRQGAPRCKCVDPRLGAPRLARLLGVGSVDEGLDGPAGEAPAPADAADDDRATALARQPPEGVGGRAEQRCDLFRVEPRVRSVTVGDG